MKNTNIDSIDAKDYNHILSFLKTTNSEDIASSIAEFFLLNCQFNYRYYTQRVISFKGNVSKFVIIFEKKRDDKKIETIFVNKNLNQKIFLKHNNKAYSFLDNKGKLIFKTQLKYLENSLTKKYKD